MAYRLSVHDCALNTTEPDDLSFLKIGTICPICGYMKNIYLNYYKYSKVLDSLDYNDIKIISNRILDEVKNQAVATKLSVDHIAYDKENRHNITDDFDIDSYMVFMKPVSVTVIDKTARLPLSKKEEK